MMRAPLGVTPSQTVGPFFARALLRDPLNVLAGPGAQGERIRIEGQVRDGDGAPVPDALVEIWQANGHGRYHHPADARDLPLDPAFSGFGRAGTDEDGRYWFETVKPGPVPAPDGSLQAPHVAVTVFARGLLNHLCTRLYFAGDPRNDADPVLRLVPVERRHTLLAVRQAAAGRPAYRFDVVLQGEAETETVFFALRR